MPKRLFDGDKAYKSDKLRAFAAKYPNWRAEYAWLKGLVLADGSFEADPNRVWAEAYSYNGINFSAQTVAKMLNAFENFGLLDRKTDDEGKIWGYWTGCEDCLPAKGERYKYKNGKGFMFNGVATQVATQSLSTSDPGSDDVAKGIGFGLDLNLVRAGAGPSGKSGGVAAAMDEVTQELAKQGKEFAIEKGQPGHVQLGKHKTTAPRRVHRLVAKAWVDIMGIGAYCPYPERFPKNWESLCDTVAADVLVPAFELWATHEGKYAGRFPTDDFLKVAHIWLPKLFKPKKEMTKEDEALTVKLAAERHVAVWATPAVVEESEGDGSELFSEDK